MYTILQWDLVHHMNLFSRGMEFFTCTQDCLSSYAGTWMVSYCTFFLAVVCLSCLRCLLFYFITVSLRTYW